jgi:hypothetical protein
MAYMKEIGKMTWKDEEWMKRDDVESVKNMMLLMVAPHVIFIMDFLKCLMGEWLSNTRFVTRFGLIAFSFPLIIIYFTHMISSSIIFLPISSLIVLPWASTLYSINKGLMSRISYPLVIVISSRIFGTFLITIFLQTMTNCAAMFYGGMRWDKVIVNEFINRNTDCYANAFINGLQVYNVGLAGLLLS